MKDVKVDYATIVMADHGAYFQDDYVGEMRHLHKGDMMMFVDAGDGPINAAVPSDVVPEIAREIGLTEMLA